MDSGSGAAFEGKLVGISSHGKPGCKIGDPMAFTNPVAAKKWIDAHII